MNFDKYKNNQPHPVHPQKPMLSLKTTSAQAKEYALKLEVYEQKMVSFKTAIEEYRKADNHLRDEFEKDVLEDLGIKDHPKAKTLLRMAWEKGHSCGYSEVYYEAASLSELLV